MRRSLHFYTAVVMLAIPTDLIAQDIDDDPCHQFGSADVIFVGRVKSAPITRRISGEDAIEKARVAMVAAEQELKAFEALKMPPEIGGQRHRDLTIRMVKAHDEYGRQRAMYPPPIDLSLTPIFVEEAFRGVTTPEVFMMDRGQPALDPTRTYLFYADLPMGFLAPDVIFAGRPKDVETAEADLRFLRDVAVKGSGTTVRGSLTFQDPDDQMRRTPLPGVVLRVSLGGQQHETTTDANGTFTLTDVPPGPVGLEPVLPHYLTLPPQQAGGMAKGGCLAVHMRATFNGRIRGRVLLDSGEPYRGFVDLVRSNHTRYVPNSSALTNERGEFAFAAVPPGDYLLGINVAREPRSGAPFPSTYFPGTTDRSMASQVTVGLGTEHADIEWVINSRLREGSIEVSFNTNGQPQKEMGVCVTMFDANNRNDGGVGYGRGSAGPVVVNVVEGVKYRLIAWARTSSGFAESEIYDVVGAPGHRALTLRLASMSEKAMGTRCAHSDKPFAP